ncbi:DMT family transporter [uncultured Sneathiella sp.]|jgi:drug/metabolite transporter (DMT)-like permease|uniref:DMT family transporter n=1 Tax=uncultured Sneathiella sp. TaxID=879315 RepID=UPI0030D91CFC|tara:strand:+ start:6842 stop:7738 length:897 start_codon:yes stop_codon:yes gene_type:complete
MLPDAAINSRNIRAILFMVVAIFFMSTMDAVAKLLVQADYSVVQILAIRGAVLMPALCVWLFTHGGLGSVKTRQYKGHALRIILGVLAPLLFFLSLRKLPLADATVIFFISPFVMTALSVPLFKEKVGVHRWGAIIVGFMGVLFVMQPTSGLLEIEAFMVLGGSLCYCGIMLTGRVLSRTETTFTIVFYSNIGLMVITGAIALFTWEPMPLQDIGFVVLMAILSLAGNICLIKSFAMGEVGVIAPFEYTGLLWAVLLGFFIFGDFPAVNVWIGVVVIAGSGLYMIYRENLKHGIDRQG